MLRLHFYLETFFSEVIIPTPVPAHIRLPEYYTADHSRPPTPNFADYPLRVDGITIYDPQNDHRFPILADRFIANNDPHPIFHVSKIEHKTSPAPFEVVHIEFE